LVGFKSCLGVEAELLCQVVMELVHALVLRRLGDVPEGVVGKVLGVDPQDGFGNAGGGGATSGSAVPFSPSVGCSKSERSVGTMRPGWPSVPS
jgi:hypothetical protein